MSIRNTNPKRDHRGNNSYSRGRSRSPNNASVPKRITDSLTDSHIIALARFIRAWQAKESRDGWRTTLANCAARDEYRRYVNADDALHLKDARNAFGPNFMCYLRTSDIANLEDAVRRSSLHHQSRGTKSTPTHESNSFTLRERRSHLPALATPPTPSSRARPRAPTRA
jgi:hypothetical protein